MNVTGRIKVFDLLQSRYAQISKLSITSNHSIAVIVTCKINSVTFSDLREPHFANTR